MRALVFICLALAIDSTPARADQFLQQGRTLDGGPNSGDILFNSLKLGKRQDGTIAPTPDAMQIQGSASTGEASRFGGRVAWSGLCRSLAARAAETVNVLDAPGVDRSGVADSAAGVRAALRAITVSGNAAYVPSGSYRLDTNVVIPSNATIEFGATKFYGSGFIENAGDWTQYRSRRSHGWLHTTTAPGNEFGVVAMMSIGPTGSTSSHEKGAGSFLAQTSDPSKYAALGDSRDVTADAVGVRGVGVINPGNLRGRAFGGEFYSFISTGAKGAGAGAEFGIDNRSGDLQPLNYQYNSSNVVSVFSKGNTPVANGVFVGQAGAGTGLYSAITVQQQAAFNWAFSILQSGTTGTALAGWRPDGSILATGLTTSGLTSTEATQLSTANALASADETQASAQLLIKDVNELTYVGSTKSGWRLSGKLGQRQLVMNRTNGSRLWPPAGMQIEGNAVNAPVTLAAGKSADFVAVSATMIRAIYLD